jgi:hypothetical protein
VIEFLDYIDKHFFLFFVVLAVPTWFLLEIIKEIKKPYDDEYEWDNSCISTVQELEELVESLREDADRYRWLRDVGCLEEPCFQNRWHCDAYSCDEIIDRRKDLTRKGL